MTSTWFRLAATLATLIPAHSTTAQDAPVSAPHVTATKVSGMRDSGKFLLYQNDERLAVITHEWHDDGRLESRVELSMAGQTVRFATKLSPASDGSWQRIDQETPLGPVEVLFEGSGARITHKGESVTLELKSDARLFENFTPVLISLTLRGYDHTRGGKQEFPLFVVPQVLMSGSLERLDQVQRSVGGRDYQLTRYTLGVPGVDITVWADADGKIYLADVPAQSAAYVREGFEALRETPNDDPLLSQPAHEVREQRGVLIPTRDGVQLSTDLFFPALEGKFPVILIRTPYKKEMSELEGKYFARRGYAVAIQDVRGRFGSSGVWEALVNDSPDGADTIEWLAAQPWSSGKVGMIGGSYLGWVQWLAAAEKPRGLVTIIPNVSPPDPFYNIPYEYGVFFLFGAIWWSEVVDSEATADLSGATFSKIGDRKYNQLLRDLPVIDLDRKVMGKENATWRTWIKHNTADEYWERASFFDRLQHVRIPVFHQSGWFDGDGIGSKLNYLKMASHGHPHQKLILGPWGHTDQATRVIGDRDFGPAAIVDLSRAYLRWFDYWLKGVENGITSEPLVSLFVMGSNKWLHGPTYPLPETRFEKWFFSSNGNANTSRGDGALTRQEPAGAAPPDRYRYDPADPTPTPLYYEAPSSEGQAPLSVEEKKKTAEGYHEQVTQSRSDILVYATPPLEQPLTFAGPVSAVIYASTSAKDTDWFARLVEIDKQGKTFALVEGKIRARFRESMRTPTLLEPEKIYAYTLDLWHTGITIPAGHRLRVEVASASFPMFSRNLNTGGHNEMETEFISAEQVIYHDAERPSHVLLPVIPE